MSMRLLLVTLLLLLSFETAETTSVGSFTSNRCAACSGLQLCTAMNGKLLFDPVVGYTREASAQLEKQGVCEDLDARTSLLSRFGPEFQFKDTTACHALVWNFHCLSWVSEIFSRSIIGKEVACSATSTGSPSSATLPLPPCRSLCVEVADKCVYSHFYRAYLENVCGNMACISEEEEEATANSSSPLVEPDCVPGAWTLVPNTTFSRCSIREYVPPKASAELSTTARLVVGLQLAVVLALAT